MRQRIVAPVGYRRPKINHAARSHLGQEAFDAAFREGMAMSITLAVSYALEEPKPAEPGQPAGRRADGLTQREGEVAALIGQGLSNRQIAARLVISTRTAESHVEAARTISPLLQVMPNDFAVLSIYGMALKKAGQQPEAADALHKALSIRESATLRRALEEITRPSMSPQPVPPTRQQPVSPAPVGAATAGTLAGALDVAGRPDTRDSLRGALVHQWHRSVFSFLSLWLGLVVVIGGAFFFPLLSALGAVMIIWAALRYAVTRYTVYERRIDFASGVLFQRRNPIWLYDITDISMRRSPMLAGKSAIDIRYETTKKKAGSESLIAVASAAKMREFMEQLQANVLHERRAMKKMWI